MAKSLNHMALRFLLVTLLALFPGRRAAGETFSIGADQFELNGQPFQIRCGEMHFARIPREYWAQRLRMAHALGLNTVCAYLFWNLNEPEPGKFDFSGNADAAEFCRLAQAEGLHVILRPGPYSCAEWDFGGLPYWLLRVPDIKLRSRDPRFLDACKQYLTEVGRQLAPLQISRGGPIIMVQVENEYGSYGNDREYMGAIRDTLKNAGFDVPFFTCDGPTQLKNDSRPDIFCAVNFGSDPAKNFAALRAVRPTGPLFVSEFYPGWFDSWGEHHHVGSAQTIVSNMAWILDHQGSFSLYMAHGGTTFGFDAGANCPPFVPESTSYDYDAPISEAGWDTPKFYALREMLSRHLNPGETLPPVPTRPPVMTIPSVPLTECAELFQELPPPVHSPQPLTMESLGQAHGALIYRTQLPSGPAGKLKIEQLHDYGLIFLDGHKIATLDRRHGQNTTSIPARDKSTTLDLFIDTFGHVNYGPQMLDPKGITRRVLWMTDAATNELSGWDIFKSPFEDAQLHNLVFHSGRSDLPAFYRGRFELSATEDTFLDLSQWGKGVVWLNGHNLGRYWNIGPQQTLYCPGVWLQKGSNEIVVFESDGMRQPVIAGLDKPILDNINRP